MSDKLSTVPEINIPTSIQEETTPSIKSFDYPTEIVELPSKGLVYDKNSPLSTGKIEMRYMTAKDEDILSTQSYIVQGTVLDKLFESMIVSKIKYEDLIVGDKNAIMLAARIYGYGPEYVTNVVTESGQKLPLTINLSEIGHKTFDESLITPGINQFSFILPTSKHEITFKLLTVKDQAEIAADLKGLKKLGKVGGEANLTTRLRFMILSVNGAEDKGTINKFVNNMLARDSRALREYINTIQPDVDLSVEMEDPKTGETFLSDISLGLDLFYPDYKG